MITIYFRKTFNMKQDGKQIEKNKGPLRENKENQRHSN